MKKYKDEDAEIKKYSIHIAEERKEGVEEGRIKERTKMVRDLIKSRVDLSVIASASGLSIEEIKNLKP